jgi:hypothetical protein
LIDVMVNLAYLDLEHSPVASRFLRTINDASPFKARCSARAASA